MPKTPRAGRPTQPRRRPDATLLLALCLALGACSSARKNSPAVVQPVVQAAGQRSITVTDAQAGASVVLEAGQALIVKLALSAASGREWSLADRAPGVLALEGSTFERVPRNESPFGDESAGTMIWRFKPQAPGSVGLRFELRRPRTLEPAPPAVTFAVTVK